MQDLDYVFILSTLQEIPFNVGKGTLADVLTGAVTKKIVSNDTYMDLKGYGSLENIPRKRVEQWIDSLIHKEMIIVLRHQRNPHWRLLSLTAKGAQEIREPTLHKKQEPRYTVDSAGDAAKQLMQQFSFFLERFNEGQQHAIVSPHKKILCVAGAGSGKTTVLTHRIKFLTQFRGVQPHKILAITFTRKAREEMQERLKGIPAQIVTFNSFCEQLLRKNGRAKPIISYGQKMQLFRHVVKSADINIHALTLDYFTKGQRSGVTHEELVRRLASDVYSIIDHYANEDKQIPESGSSDLATTLLTLARRIAVEMDARNTRDYSGQLTEALTLLREHPSVIPQYTHVLVDEYQDVNSAQVKLLSLLDPENLFVVGDPRQSIYGWRGSKIQYILDFDADCTIQLKHNYRSCKEVVHMMNPLIKDMNLPDLEPACEHQGAVQVLQFPTDDEERVAIAHMLSGTEERDIFVLARTNKQLQELSGVLNAKRIPHTIRHEEDAKETSGIILATAHAIKGLEAKMVIVMGVSNKYFPCKVSDHPVIDLIKDPTFNKEAEELRLLYVAISRAKDALIVTHTGSRSYLLEPALGEEQTTSSRDDASYDRLRKWRSKEAMNRNLPAYCIFSDKTLRQLSDQQPQTLHELSGVHGIGEEKLSRYGQEILDVIRGHATIK